ncbi:MAG: Ig-like domain-containing protein [Acidobacteria bacterium]|nr:Ig-like domain-containing protein [Acidobacteriota bacterium]
MRLRVFKLFILSVVFVMAGLWCGPLTGVASSRLSPLDFWNPEPGTRNPEPERSSLKIKQRNPVTNEGNQITLMALDAQEKPASGVMWSSGSPDIAEVDPQTGRVRGVRQGFATVTASNGNTTDSVFVVVTRVKNGPAEKVPGETKVDQNGRLYLTNPAQNTILRATDALNASLKVFAGQRGARGLQDGSTTHALFAGPTAIGIDGRVQGGVYVADTLNHCVRKIGFTNQVETVLGTGDPGTPVFDSQGSAALNQMVFRSPRGIAVESGGNLFLADTDNHAIYFVDLGAKRVWLLAGRPGQSGVLDGTGIEARFSRPAGLALNSTGRVLAVADQDNNRVRLLELTQTESGSLTCRVSTVGTQSAARAFETTPQSGEPIEFSKPGSLSFDSVDNLNVVDETGAFLVTQPLGQYSRKIDLAQPEVTFNQPFSVTIRGTDTFVLDPGAAEDRQALKIVTVGGPEITDVNRETVRAEGGEEVIVTGKNFAPESIVSLGDAPVEDLQIESATQCRFRVPRQRGYGNRTLTIQTRGGLVQRSLAVIPKPLSELAVGEITTVVGGMQGVGDGRLATAATVNYPTSTAIDSSGNMYVADTSNRIRRVDAQTGIITTIAGTGRGGFSPDGTLAVTADLAADKVVIDQAGNLLINDNYRIRRIDLRTGVLTTIAGTGSPNFRGDGGPAIEAGINPDSFAIDRVGNLFIVDRSSRIRRVDAQTGIITTVAGTGKREYSGDGGPATRAGLFRPSNVAVDGRGNLFIADRQNHRIRRVDAQTGIITTVAGSGAEGLSGDGGPATAARLSYPLDVVIDADENLLITDSGNQRIRKVNQITGIISTLVGSGPAGFGGFEFGGDNGLATQARLGYPHGIAIDGAGNLFICDSFNHRLRRVDAQTDIITTVAGNGIAIERREGDLATSYFLQIPTDVVVTSAGDILVSDLVTRQVFRVDALTGRVALFAGNGKIESKGDGGPATKASFDTVSQLGIDEKNNLYIVDNQSLRVRKVNAQTGVITTIAGNGTSGSAGDGGPATAASLEPWAVLPDLRNNQLLITDPNNSQIRRVDLRTGLISTLVSARQVGSELVKGKRFSPGSLATDQEGNLFISDPPNNRIRRLDARTGMVTTVVGGNQFGYGGDNGPASEALINQPGPLVIDGAGNLFFVDSSNRVVRKIEAQTGVISTVAGGGLVDQSGLGGDGKSAVTASFSLISGLALDAAGNLYLAEYRTTGESSAVRVVKGIAIP